MANVIRKVRINSGKVVSVRVPEEWGKEEIRKALKNRYTPSNRLISFLKDQEGGGAGPQYSSPEGGSDTIGFGHKLKKGEIFDNLTESEANELLVRDIRDSAKTVRTEVPNFNSLSQNQKDMLVEFSFNLGSLKKFPKFKEAVVNGDFVTAAKESKRFYTDKAGNTIELKRRNNAFLKTFLPDVDLEEPEEGVFVDDAGNITVN